MIIAQVSHSASCFLCFLSLLQFVFFLPFSVYSSFLFSLPLSCIFPFLSALHLCFFCLFLPSFPHLSLCPSLSLPLPSFSETYFSLCLSISIFHLFPFYSWVPLYSYLPLMSFHFSSLPLCPSPSFQRPHLTEALLKLPICLTQLFKETTNVTPTFLPPQL